MREYSSLQGGCFADATPATIAPEKFARVDLFLERIVSKNVRLQGKIAKKAYRVPSRSSLRFAVLNEEGSLIS